MTEIRESSRIRGVKFAVLKPFGDERGRFLETFRREWFPERSWEAVQANRSDSREGVLRGLHYHRRQIDYWVPMAGRIRIALVDIRRGSPTRGGREVIDLDEQEPMGVFVPVGVAHGFLALTDCTLAYVVDNYYDGDDELGVAWDDPDLAVPWGVTDPVLSGRDRANPRLAEIPEAELPEWEG